MRKRPEEALFAKIADPVERALQREQFRLETEIAHLVHLQNDKPWSEDFDLRQELQTWMIEHVQDSAKKKLSKMDEFEARSKPIHRRIERWRRMDVCAVMDREFELRRQVEQIEEYRQKMAWYDRREKADDTMIAMWRLHIRLEEMRLEALSKSCAKKATQDTEVTVP